MASPVITTSPYGRDSRESFIGVACWDDSKEVNIYLDCILYPNAIRIKDEITILNDQGKTLTQEELSAKVRELAEAVIDQRDSKRFVINSKKQPNALVDTVVLQFGSPPESISARTSFSTMSTVGMRLQALLFSALYGLDSSPLKNYPHFLSCIRELQLQKTIRYPVKFLVDFEDERLVSGWTE